MTYAICQLGIITDNELKTYNTELKYIKEIKLKNVQYTVTNKILVTKTFLHRINKVNNDLSEYCISLKEYFTFLTNVKKLNSFGIH